MNLFRNKEYKQLMSKLLILFIFMAVILCVVSFQVIRGLQAEVYEQNAAMLGRLSVLYPGHENELAVALLERPSQTEIQKGYGVLSQYGYTPHTKLDQAPLIRTGIGSVFLYGAFFLLVFGIALYVVLSLHFGHIYKKLDHISKCAEKIVEGEYSLHIDWDGEGSFAILGHHFNQMTDRLKNSMERLKAEKTFLKDIIADISHQFKTPLATLIINNDILLGDEGMDNRTRTKFLESSSQQLQRLEWLIQSLLKMARLESGSIIFKKERLPVSKPVYDAIETLSAMAEDARVELTFTDKSSQVLWNGDPEWLREALVNIIKNCIEHCNAGGKVTAEAYETPLTSGVIIRDNGEGISKEELPHIFKRFYKGHHPKPSSVGIGLSLSRAIVEGHGGSIVARSEKGRGTEFTVILLKDV